jgi:outer membrane receptor protein involved in Fe transport
LRASAKNLFRLPTFDDLYYTLVGNTALRPEKVNQWNAGFTWLMMPRNTSSSISLTADGYYNAVRDKILAVPRQNLFQWSMQNIGRVRIFGIDANLQMQTKRLSGWAFSGQVNYSFQDAQDRTDANSPTFKQQLPYTPKHSGSVVGAVVKGAWSFGYNVVLSSFRYRAGEQLPTNLVKEWATQDASIGYRGNWGRKANFFLRGEVNNIFNRQYEIIRYYPMPGINYRLSVTVSINQLKNDKKKKKST